jgi:hypothetical protein
MVETCLVERGGETKVGRRERQRWISDARCEVMGMTMAAVRLGFFAGLWSCDEANPTGVFARTLGILGMSLGRRTGSANADWKIGIVKAEMSVVDAQRADAGASGPYNGSALQSHDR